MSVRSPLGSRPDGMLVIIVVVNPGVVLVVMMDPPQLPRERSAQNGDHVQDQEIGCAAVRRETCRLVGVVSS